MEKKKIISKRMKKKLKARRCFRNVLVHRYREVNEELVYENLENINDFKEFMEETSLFLKK